MFTFILNSSELHQSLLTLPTLGSVMLSANSMVIKADKLRQNIGLTMKKIAVILSGCGVYDGSEIHEAVLTLLAIEQQGASYHCFAPNIAQHHVINHLTGEVSSDESRNVLIEAARIGRGDVEDLVELREQDFDGIIFIGGFT